MPSHETTNRDKLRVFYAAEAPLDDKVLGLIREIERLREAGNAAFFAMCAYRDMVRLEDEDFQDAIDKLGVALSEDHAHG